jgi:hypothetical protein
MNPPVAVALDPDPRDYPDRHPGRRLRMAVSRRENSAALTDSDAALALE